MAAEPLVSIVIPAYEPRADWIRAAVASALDEPGCQVEVIVVDDGSAEPVAHLVAGQEDARLRVIRVEHAGAAHARNAGMRAARGAYVRFADADDLIEPGSTGRLLRLASARGSIAYGATLVCDAGLRPTGMKSSALEGWIAEACLLRGFDVKHFAMLFPRAVIEAAGEWETTMPQCEDWDFVLRALDAAPVVTDGQVAARYRRHGGSLGSDVGRALRYERLVVDRYFERHPERAGTRLERRARAALLTARVRAGWRLARRRQALDLAPLARATAGDLLRTLATFLPVRRPGRRPVSRTDGDR